MFVSLCSQEQLCLSKLNFPRKPTKVSASNGDLALASPNTASALAVLGDQQLLLPFISEVPHCFLLALQFF